MAKYDAYGAVLHMGVRQVETAVVVGTITLAGNAHFTLTKAGMAGSGNNTDVAVLLNDTPTMVAAKAVTALNAVPAYAAACKIEASGPYIIVTAVAAAADDGTFNLAYANDTCTGLVNDATSNNTTAGVALTDVAQIISISGPGLGVDTEDVTTHDSSGAFEQHVATVIRSGELSLEIVYDPVAATQNNTTGLLSKLSNRALAQYQIVFPDAALTTWTFDGYGDGFEPGNPTDGALTATAKVKVTGQPTLA